MVNGRVIEMILETERLILRKPLERDWKAIYNSTDINVIKNFFMPYPYKSENTKKFISQWIKEWGIKSYWMVVELKGSNRIIGICGIRDLDKYNLNAEVLYWIASDYRKKEYAFEAMMKIYEFCFNSLGLMKLKSEVASFNKASNEMQKKLGMKFDGTKRKEYLNPYTKKFVDMNIYSILKGEWKKIAPKLKKELKKKIKN